MTDTLGLKALLVRRGITLEQLSELTGLSKTTLSLKINGIREFKASEIVRLQEVLKISDKERDLIFLNGR